MTHDERIDAMERDVRTDKLSSIRFRLVVLLYAIACVVPDFRSIYNSMNVELPWATRALVFAGGALEDWWFLLVPAAWVGWRMFEDRYLRTASLTRMRMVCRVFALAVLAAAYALYMPMLKLINNVG